MWERETRHFDKWIKVDNISNQAVFNVEFYTDLKS